MPASPRSLAQRPGRAAFTGATPVLQRKCACGGTPGPTGECAECRRTQRLGLQAKLRVTRPGDRWEREADRVAQWVVRPGEERSAAHPRVTPLVRRAGQEGGAGVAPPAVEGVLCSAGRPLDGSTRGYMEQRFGRDFGSVRVHTDARAADSALAVGARAYTVGQNVVFGSWQYRPEAAEGRHLIAHELTHVLQQAPASAAGVVQRTDGGTPAGPSSATPQWCDDAHTRVIETALAQAREWRGAVLRWFDEYLKAIRARAGIMVEGRYAEVGPRIHRDMQLLEEHFRISEVLRNRRVLYPQSATDDASTDDFQEFASAIYEIRRYFRDVELSALIYHCQADCPQSASGADRLGSAQAGSREFTIYTGCFDDEHEDTKAAVVMHEAFHATFFDFDHDSYSHRAGYPGHSPRTNADSYATFASVIATGSSYRIIRGEETRIEGTAR